MDHQHRHHPHHQFQGHSSRYAPLPPQKPPTAPVLLAPDPYRRQPHLSFPPQTLLPPLPPPPTAAAAHHHHRHPDSGGVVYVSYAPSSSHASDDRGRLLVPADPPDRLVVKAPHPPLPVLRVSDRIIFPEGHPEAPRVHHHPRRSGGGEAFAREDFKRERVRVLGERQGGIPYGRREGEAVELAEQGDVARRLGLLGRKRPRWEEGRALGEDTLLECFLQGRDPKRLTSGASTSRRRCNVAYDLRAVDAESSRGSTSMFASERGEAVLAFPRLLAEVPLRSSSSVYSVSKPELLGKSPTMESETLALGGSHGFREKNLAGRGKRYVFGGEEEVHAPSKKMLQQKPSVLSRIQFAKPVYKRKCEQEIISTMSSLPVSQTLAFSEGSPFEMDVPVKLDVSLKSDVLVAKEILPTPVSASPRSIGEARTAKKNVAKVTTVSPNTSLLKSDSKVALMQTYKMKIREERFTCLNSGGKPNKERTPKNKVSHKFLASSNEVVQNLDGEVTGLRSPRNTVAKEVLITPNLMQSSTGRVSPARMTEKKMAEKNVATPDAAVGSHDGKLTSTRSPKRKPAKDILVPQSNVMPNPNDMVPTLKTLKLPGCDGIITTERCPEEKLAMEILVNSPDAEPDSGGTVNCTGGTGKKLAKETLVTQKAVSLHCREMVTSVNDPKKEVSDNISFPSIPVVTNAEGSTIIERPKAKPDKDTSISPGSVVNSDKKITMTRTLRKKIIKKNKKKKVVSSIAPCLPSMDPPREIGKGCLVTNGSLKGIEPSKQILLASTTSYSHMEQRYLKEENRDMKYSETVQKLPTSGSSCEDLKDLEDIHAKLVLCDPEGMTSTIVRSLKKESIKTKSTGEFTLIPCALDSCPVQAICEMPLLNGPYDNLMHSKEVQRGSLSNCFQKDLSCSEEAHKDALHGEEVHQDRVNAGEVHSGSVRDSCQDVGHLEDVRNGSTKTTACMDPDLQGKGQEQHILTSCHNDATSPVSLGKTETTNVGNSTLELPLQRIMLPGYLETNIVEAASNAPVPVEVDTNENSQRTSSTENAAENFKSSVQQGESRGDGNLNFREDSVSGEHLSSLKEIFLLDTVCGVHDEYVAFFDEESSLKADITSSNRVGGQKLSLRPQSGGVLEELETVCCEKDAATVLHCHMQGKSVPLQVEAQTAVPESERERKQKQSPAQGVILTKNKLGKVDNENNVVGGERSRRLRADVLALPMEARDAILDSNLLVETDGQECVVLHLPFIDRVECPAVNSMAEQVADRVHSSALGVSEENSPEDLATVSEEMHSAEVKQTVCDLLDNKSCHGCSIVEKQYGDSNGKNDYLCDSKTLPVAELKISGKSDLINLSDCLVSGKVLPQQTQEAEKQLNNNHQLTGKGKLTGMKVCQRPGISKIYPNQKSLNTRTFKKTPSHSVRHNKWYRTENPPVSSSPGQMKCPGRCSLPRQSPKKLGKIQSSYIRKGNSLIRKSSPAIPSSSHPYPEQTALDQIRLPETNKSMSIEDKIVRTDHVSFSSAISSARTLNSSFERPKTPPLPLSAKSAHPHLNSPQTLTEDPLSEPGGEDNGIPSVGTQGFDPNEENRSIALTEESKVSGKKKLVYVKHRSNQLIAAPATDANDASDHTTEESPASPFALPDIYYRNKNKLIRDTSLADGQLKQEISLPIDCSDAKCHGPSMMSSLKDGAIVPRTRLGKVMEKTYKRSRFSLVWTLNGTRSQNNKCSNVLKHQKVLPYLVPWKRTTYWRDFVTNMGSNWSKHSPSLISRKLQLSRQRGTIYTISGGGFSLRKSGVLSVGGSNLKWSKSMERRSRKAGEEATLAIVEHERKKKKQKGTPCSDVTMKSGNCSQHKVALGIQLHQDEQTQVVTSSQSVRGGKMSIVPRRLLIGNDEYIRVGNGNQLVRDPKKLVRMLANEKIRWSLHTARLRSVRKQQYCQFFTRFGKCNKEDGKCPYIHDPTKIAICTKFLKGLCSSPNCKLTHKVIPERMPDCSYFLQGLCTNMSCPYRHVNVNPKASVCEGFLKGYCRDGDECRKKHRYVCPYFEASGECHQRSTCKLHHPKRGNKQSNKSRKRKRSPIRDHGRGRYFGCSVAEIGDSKVFTSNMDAKKKDEHIFFHGGRFAEYISLDVDSDDAAVGLDHMDSHSILMDSVLSDSQSSDVDALIKPVRIMKADLR